VVIVKREMPVCAKPIGFSVIAIFRANRLDHGGSSWTFSGCKGIVIAFNNTLDAIVAKKRQPGRLPERLPKWGNRCDSTPAKSKLGVNSYVPVF
jgi:hypothetical protein